MTVLSCPLCSVALTSSSLEPHLRLELRLPLLACSLCPQSFLDTASAEQHFRGPFAEHPDRQPLLIRLPEEPAQTTRLLELLRLARGGSEAIQQRLCVCGHCRLLCQEETRLTSRQALPRPAVKAPSVQDTRINPNMPAARGPKPNDRVAALDESSEEELPREVEEERIEPAQEEETESRQEETPIQTDVKPSLAELKPQLATDGKVTCLQCEKRVDKNVVAAHVRLEHIHGNPFQCLLCPQNGKTRQAMGRHQKQEHGIEMSKDTFTESISKEVLRDWIKLCFGEAQNAEYKKHRCRPCDRLIHPSHMKEHVAVGHLKKPLFKCTSCGQTSNSAHVRDINRHLMRVHKLAPGPESIDSSGLMQYAPIIKAMISQLFEK